VSGCGCLLLLQIIEDALRRLIQRQENHMVVPQVIDPDSICAAFSQKAQSAETSPPIISRQGAWDRKGHG
jgi:hypothetical protein